MQELTDTLNNGETEVLVVPKGEFYGSDSKGNPIPESIDEQVIDLEAQLQGKELLVDKDHSSVKEGNDRDTSAMGWMHSFKKGVEGLLAKIRWTNIGRNLVENRVFRFLSPVFTLKGDKPTNMLNVALTNQPAFQEKAKPIINNQPTMETITMEMTKEELIELIKQTIIDLKKEKKLEEIDDAIENENEVHEDIVDNLEQEKQAVEAGIIQNSEPANTEDEEGDKTDDEKKAEETSAENACGDKTDEVKNEEVEETKEETVEETKEETKDEDADKPEETDDDKEEEDKEEDKKEEVIKIDALNSVPKTFGLDIVQNTGKEQPRYPGEGYAIVKKVF